MNPCDLEALCKTHGYLNQSHGPLSKSWWRIRPDPEIPFGKRTSMRALLNILSLSGEHRFYADRGDNPTSIFIHRTRS